MRPRKHGAKLELNQLNIEKLNKDKFASDALSLLDHYLTIDNLVTAFLSKLGKTIKAMIVLVVTITTSMMDASLLVMARIAVDLNLSTALTQC